MSFGHESGTKPILNGGNFHKILFVDLLDQNTKTRCHSTHKILIYIVFFTSNCVKLVARNSVSVQPTSRNLFLNAHFYGNTLLKYSHTSFISEPAALNFFFCAIASLIVKN